MVQVLQGQLQSITDALQGEERRILLEQQEADPADARIAERRVRGDRAVAIRTPQPRRGDERLFRD